MKKRQKLGEILAANLNRLMDNHPILKSNKALGSREGLSTGTVGRVRNCEVSPTLDTVEALAEAFSISPLDLLRGSDSGQIGPLTTTETMLVVLFRALPEEAQRRIILEANNPSGREDDRAEEPEWVELKEHFMRASQEERRSILGIAKASVGVPANASGRGRRRKDKPKV
jgi:transcriptional regulator with XRE-family HTH domain